VTNLAHKLNVSSSVRIYRQSEDCLTLQYDQLAFHLENEMQVEKGLPIEVRHEKAYFDV